MPRIYNLGAGSAEIKALKDLKRHPMPEHVVIEDFSTFAHLKSSNRDLITFIYCPELIYSEEGKELVSYFTNHSQNTYTVSKKLYQSLCEKDNAAGLFGILNYGLKNIEDIDPSKYDFIVVLDRIENPGNLGTIIRTCDGAKVGLIIHVDPIVNLFTAKALAASRGMGLFINQVVCSYDKAQEFLLKNDYTIYLGEPDLGKPYYEYDYQGRIALVVGSERFGINPKWYDNPHQKVFIPMKGKMGCLNVSIATSILIYEADTKRTRKENIILV